MMIRGAMTVVGFTHLLRTHGIIAPIIGGHTPPDEDVATRGAQIRAWLLSEGVPSSRSYAVVDDEAFDIQDHGHPLVRTNGAIGLTVDDADRLIWLLRER
jgi:hypothetical protein